MNRPSPFFVVLFAALAPLAGCLGPQRGPSTIEATDEAAGANCEYGGVRFDLGFDDDFDGRLDPGEITRTTYGCNMRVDGRNAAVRLVKEAAGSRCPTGGTRIEAGIDSDANGQLDGDEVESTAYVCNGSNGKDGTDGTDGTDGVDGTDGEDGATTLIRLVTLPVDPNGHCYYGGTEIDVGLDVNGDGVLQPGEITDRQYVCSVHVNENMTLVANSPEPPGANCENGGVKMQVGYDSDGDKVLDAAEVQSTNYVCNQVILVSGSSSLIVTAPATAQQCPFGGTVYQVGLDSNQNGKLDSAEITGTSLICNGADGYTSLVSTGAYSGSLCGPEGGLEFRTGLDTNYDHVLQSSEVLSTSYLCHGTDGFLGYDGKNSLIRSSADTTVCGPLGGLRFDTGLDANANGFLESGEITQTSFVCNGADGYDALVVPYDAGSACGIYGGVRYDSGLDFDRDGWLDSNEVTGQAWICNGVDGYDALVVPYDAGGDCGAYGGVRYDSGLDYDRDGWLDWDEVTGSAWVCNGVDGYDALVETSYASSWDCPDGGTQIDVGLDYDRDGWLDGDEITSTSYVCVWY